MLKLSPWRIGKPLLIMAGTTLKEFMNTIPKLDGAVYINYEDIETIKEELK